MHSGGALYISLKLANTLCQGSTDILNHVLSSKYHIHTTQFSRRLLTKLVDCMGLRSGPASDSPGTGPEGNCSCGRDCPALTADWSHVRGWGRSNTAASLPSDLADI